MFEDIHFITEENFTDIHELMTNPDNQKSYESFAQENPDSIQAMKGEIRMEGGANALFQLPMSPNNRRNLLYIQSFSWMKMGEHYYTHRKNYHSYLLLYTYEGEGCLEYEGKTYCLQPGDGFLIDCRKEHTYYTNGPYWEHSDIHFNGGICNYLYQQCFLNHTPIFHCPLQGKYQYQLENVLRYHTSTDLYREYYTSASAQQLLMLVLSLQADKQKESSIPDYIVYLQRYLECHFSTDISIDDMARFCGLSKYYMIHQFKRYTSVSPKEYVTSLRITRAKQLLVDTKIAAYKIGIMVGMENEANFIRTFKLQTGMTPGEYRKQMG